jgi:hypothetical protein
MKQKKLLVDLAVVWHTFHLLRCGPTSFERRFTLKFEESLHAPRKTVRFFREFFLHNIPSVQAHIAPHCLVSMPHVEKLAGFACAAAASNRSRQALEQYMADWQASQYQSWRSGEAQNR